MTQKCPEGKYYCHTMKKCKSIPRGYHVGRGGYLVQDEEKKLENLNLMEMVVAILTTTVMGTATLMALATALMEE